MKRYSVSEQAVINVGGILIVMLIVVIVSISAVFKHIERTDYYKSLLNETKIELNEAESEAENWKLEAYKAQNQLKDLGYE